MVNLNIVSQLLSILTSLLINSRHLGAKYFDVAGPKKKTLKGARWALFKHSSNRTEIDNSIIKKLSKCNRRIYRAWVLKDEFEQFWNYLNPNSAKAFLEQWMKTAMREAD